MSTDDQDPTDRVRDQVNQKHAQKEDTPITVSWLKNKHDSAPRRQAITWTRLVEGLAKVRRTQCRVEDCLHSDCVQKNGLSWTPAVYPIGSARKKRFVESVSLLVIDLDHLTEDAFTAARAKLASYRYLLHASHSDRPAQDNATCNCARAPNVHHDIRCPKYSERCVRAIVALSRPVKRDEWARFWNVAMHTMGFGNDPSMCDASKLYFLPSRPSDAVYYFSTHEGVAIDVEALLKDAPQEEPSDANAFEPDEDEEAIEPGQRHAMLTSLASTMRFRGSGYAEIETALLAENRARCRPPKSDEEVRAIARWVADQPRSKLSGEDEPSDEEDQEDFERDKKGKIFNSRRNIELAMRKIRVRLRYDEFSNEELIEGLPGFGPRLDDPAVANLWLEIDRHCHFLPGWQLFEKVVNNSARVNNFHPVRDYLATLAWDHEPRIERWLIDYAGAPDTPYVRAVSRIVLVAAVRRARHPGAKYDEMLILESEQGTNKSSGLRALSVKDDWFTDDLPLSSDTARFIEATAGKWIVEAGELKGMGKSDVAALKACLSRQRDEARLAWGRKSHRAFRQFVLIGTTNEFDGYLRDTTGNRRFWPVRIQFFDLIRLRIDRDQLWAEAAEAEAAGESIRLDPKLYGEAAIEQEARLRGDDPLVDVLHRALGNRTGKLRVADAYTIVGLEPGKVTQDQMERFGKAIRDLGWERLRRRFNGELQYAYVKGTAEQRDVELIVESDPLTRVVRIEAQYGAPAPAN